ncbi:MAG: EAL domain-containing protein [Deltaproteobacteria bacterium]|nr:EAL domain-containing protein [Deltaproteobacteria bacterium]
MLVVDNHPATATILGRYLQRAGYEVVAASGLAEARQALSAGGLDVVLTDLGLEDGNGLEVLEASRAADPHLPVLFLTGSDQIEPAVRALEGGALRYLRKPIRAPELCDAVDQARRAREASAQTRPHPELTAALAAMHLVTQPIVSWSRRTIVGYEALLRSRHQTLSRPDQLLGAAERAGRIHELGRSVRAHAAALVPELPADADLFVNLHPAELADPDLYAPDAPLSRHAARVVLEITERAALAPGAPPDRMLAALRNLGYRIAVDDLGAGYSSLSSLTVLHPDVIKIDISLVRGVHTDPTRQLVLRALLHLGAQLGVMTIVEGIETHADLGAVVAAGGDHVQGYLFARPGAPPPSVDFEPVAAALREEGRWANRTARLPARLDGDASPWSRRGELARTLCHDARVPLAAIVALVQRVHAELDATDPVARTTLGDELLARVAQVDALIGALSAVID